MSSEELIPKIKPYIDGLLLSDGHIQNHRNINRAYIYVQSCSNREWLDIICNDFFSFGIFSSVGNKIIRNTGWSNKNGNVLYQLYTNINSYVYFKEQSERWYRKWYDIDNYNKYFWHKDETGDYFIWKKVIPRDIELSQEFLANEYLGDGSINNTRGNAFQIQLSTYSFLRDDVVLLSDKIDERLDIKSSVTSRNAIIITKRRSVLEFLNYIKEYEISCYAYKFPKKLMRSDINV